MHFLKIEKLKDSKNYFMTKIKTNLYLKPWKKSFRFVLIHKQSTLEDICGVVAAECERLWCLFIWIDIMYIRKDSFQVVFMILDIYLWLGFKFLIFIFLKILVFQFLFIQNQMQNDFLHNLTLDMIFRLEQSSNLVTFVQIREQLIH